MTEYIGLVSYKDTVSPEKPYGDIFRKVYKSPGETNVHLLIGKCMCGGIDKKTGEVIPPCGDLSWRAHTDPLRKPVIFVVPEDSEAAMLPMTGVP